MSSSVWDISTRTSLVLLIGCASAGVRWSGTAVAPEGNTTRESAIDGLLASGDYFEKKRIVLDRSFESQGFEGVPFALEGGDGEVLSLDASGASLRIELERASLGDKLQIIDTFVPHFFLDTEVPGVGKSVRYVLVCKGGTGRLRIAREGAEVHGDLAISVACRTYVGGSELDESEIHLAGAFRAGIK